MPSSLNSYQFTFSYSLISRIPKATGESAIVDMTEKTAAPAGFLINLGVLQPFMETGKLEIV
jgi:hypothetical protein